MCPITGASRTLTAIHCHTKSLAIMMVAADESGTRSAKKVRRRVPGIMWHTREYGMLMNRDSHVLSCPCMLSLFSLPVESSAPTCQRARWRIAAARQSRPRKSSESASRPPSSAGAPRQPKRPRPLQEMTKNRPATSSIRCTLNLVRLDSNWNQ